MYAKTYKVINGLTWHFHGYYHYKSDAKQTATRLRKEGYLVRTYKIEVTRGHPEYALYTLEKKYSKHLKKAK